jgi:Fe2+ or Zn2+ uptake regulation protein
VCVECGAVEDFEGPGLPDLERAVDHAMRAIRRRHRFAVAHHRLDFFGTCSTCANGGG